MKKFTCVFMALMIACLVCAGAVADTYNVEIDYEGEYVTYDDTFSLYIPNTFSDEEVTSDMEDSGIFAYYLDETNGVAMTVQWIMPDDGSDIEDIYNSMLSNSDYQNVSVMTFNEVPFIIYDSEANGSFGCMCADGTEDGGVYIFSFAPDTPESSQLALKIMASIQ